MIGIAREDRMINTALTFEEDGSVVVDLTEDEKDVRRRKDIHGIQSDPTTHAIVCDEVVPNYDIHKTPLPSPFPPKRTRNHRWLSVVLGMVILLCFACGIYFYWQSKQQSTSASSNQSSEHTATPITEEELALHSDVINDCWILIDDTVYDVTQYAPSHPGGAEYVTDFCGSNATKDFYINHPMEYIQIYLSSDTHRGVISTNMTDRKSVV